jgi:hypothetical protein
MTTSDNSFTRLAAVNINAHLEKKNNLSYLSWAWAVDQLLRLDPDAKWEYPEAKLFGDTMMVFCDVTAFGRTRRAQLPVMDHRNKPIPNPDAFAVNTAMQRCLVKAIALHGLGLYVYAGEDLPPNEDGSAGEKPAKPSFSHPANLEGKERFEDSTPEAQQWYREQAMEIMGLFKDGKSLVDWVEKQNYSLEDKLTIWHILPSDVRTEYKRQDKERAIATVAAKKQPALATQA